MIYEIVHTTRYDYDAPVTASYAEVYQLPYDVDGQRCTEHRITTEPESSYQRSRQDYFGNLAAVLEVHEPHTTLKVHSISTVETTNRPTELPVDARRPWKSFVLGPATGGDDRSEHDADLSTAEFAMDSPLVTRSSIFADYALLDFTEGVSLGGGLLALNSRIHREFVFDTRATNVDTTLEEAFELRRGVCQDFAHVLIACLRSIGLAACYISGYLETIPPPGKTRLAGADRTHAWVGVACGPGSWIGIDPTNDQLAGPRFITTARGRDYSDVPPLKGVIYTEAETSKLTVSVDVVPTLPAPEALG